MSKHFGIIHLFGQFSVACEAPPPGASDSSAMAKAIASSSAAPSGAFRLTDTLID